MSENNAPSFFIQEVLATAGKAENEDIESKVDKFANRIAAVKCDVYTALHNQYEDFIPNLTATLELSNQVKAVSEDMMSLTDRIEREIQMQLNMTSGEFQDLANRLQESQGILAILDRLVQVHDALQLAKRALASKEFVIAALNLDKVNTLLAGSADDKEFKILNALQTEYLLQKEKLIYDVSMVWNETVKWQIPKKKKVPTEIVKLSFQCGRDSSLMVNMLKSMTFMNTINAKMKNFAHHVMQHLLCAVIEYKDTSVNVNETKDLVIISIEKSTGKDKKVSEPASVFTKIDNILRTIDCNVFAVLPIDSSERITAIQAFGGELSEQLLNKLIKECLSPAIPRNSEDLSEFKTVIQLTGEFEDQLKKYGFLNKSCKSLTNYVNDVNVLFANRKCQELLVKARSLMTSDIHNMVRISSACEKAIVGKPISAGQDEDKGPENTKHYAEPKLTANLFRIVDCFISDWIVELMKLVYETLEEACLSNTENCAIQQFYSVRNLFDLFCCVVPTYHKQNLEDFPQLSALHHNNCMYVAHHLITLGHQFSRKLPASLQSSNCTFVDFVPRIRQLGVDCFQKQMKKQCNLMIDYLKETQGFQNAGDDSCYEICNRAIKQVLLQFGHLQKVWQKVLPEKMYLKSIGILLNSVVVHIISSVTSLESISADDGSQLHSLLSIIADKGSSFFNFPQDSDTSNSIAALLKYTLKWMKFTELITVLASGLVNISDRWADGKGPLANEFTVSEIKKLIRALFQNTDFRASVLSKIK